LTKGMIRQGSSSLTSMVEGVPCLRFMRISAD
jgi:hypothetical protein